MQDCVQAEQTDLSEVPINIVFVGEVDHGKSTLLGQIAKSTSSIHAARASKDLAHVMDQFEEEQRNEMTLDTAQIQISFSGYRFNLIDAPGHLELLKNMVTGTSRADCAVLVIDALQGPQVQTFRHLGIAQLIGCLDAIIAINKLDAFENPQEVFGSICETLRTPLQRFSFRSVTLIPISAFNGTGVSASNRWTWFKGPSVLEMFKEWAGLVPKDLQSGQTEETLIFPVQDVYQEGSSVQLAGRILAGHVKVDQSVASALTSKRFRVKRIIKFPQNVQTARKGDSVALELEDDQAKRRGQAKVKAGDVLIDAKETSVKSKRKITAKLIWLDQTPLSAGDKVTLRNPSFGAQGKTTWIEGGLLGYGDIGHATFDLLSDIIVRDPSIHACPLNRIVVERNKHIVCGGLVCSLPKDHC